MTTHAASKRGVLYLVATPIGNLGDITQRAIATLEAADLVAAEDTRHSGRLLQHLGLHKPLLAYHDHSDAQALEKLMAALDTGAQVALISDAGMPLIADPGYPLVRAARAAGHAVIPIPGACALIAALAASGLPADRFRFEGFLPAKAGARQARLEALSQADCTLIFYEAPHRLRDTLAAMATAFGAERPLSLAREISKAFETFIVGSVAEVMARVAADPNQCRGEMVLVVGAASKSLGAEQAAGEALVADLIAAGTPVNAACKIAARHTGAKKNALYDWAVNGPAGGN